MLLRVIAVILVSNLASSAVCTGWQFGIKTPAHLRCDSFNSAIDIFAWPDTKRFRQCNIGWNPAQRAHHPGVWATIAP
jgi:hypothetical protein